jgi:hypothetical protein
VANAISSSTCSPSADSAAAATADTSRSTARGRIRPSALMASAKSVGCFTDAT